MSVDDDDEPTRLKTLKGGDYFGEKALLFDALRSATIIAESQLEVLKISREKFHALGLNHKLNFPKRPNVGGARAVGRNVATQPATEKTCEDRAFIAQALRKNRRLQEAVSLDDSRIQKMIDIAWKQDVKAGHNLISEGDLDADFFYVVQDGIFGKTQKEDFLTLSQPLMTWSQPLMIRDSAGLVTEDTAKSVEIGRGDSFGEIALLYLVPRTATITAKTNSTVWVFDRQNFKNILMKASSAQIKENRRHLDRVLLLESLFQEEKEALAEILVEMSYSENECIMQQGESGNSFHILIEGKVAVIEDEEKVRDLSASLNGEAHAFGEKALLQNDVRTATVKVVSATAKTLVLDRGSFNLLLGPLKDIISGRTPSRSKRRGSTAEQIVADSVAILADSTSQPSSAGRPTKKKQNTVAAEKDQFTRVRRIWCCGASRRSSDG
jgi:CRP-like cAMP-binding protein